jgi:3D (Asp-Asp-Asp) domain-containing protein
VCWQTVRPNRDGKELLVLIGRGHLRLSDVLGVALLTATFVWAGFATHPSAAFASAGADASAPAVAAHTVTLEANGTTAQTTSDSATVGDFLREHDLNVGPHDYVYPDQDVPLSDGLTITYRAAVTVTIETAHDRIAVESAADDVGALLEEENIRLGPDDRVEPSLDAAIPANGTVRVMHVVAWQRTVRSVITPQNIHRLDFSTTPGSSRVIARGTRGEREDVVRFESLDGAPATRTIVSTRVLRKAHPQIIADGIDEFEAFARMEERGVARTAYLAQSAMQMVATAYTAGCAGCSGITAIGRPAGHGIVAVDPSVIPLGTRLFIPGYGLAIAGDTGGAIHGYRIDLGFNSERDALLFGRRQVTVYRLR